MKPASLIISALILAGCSSPSPTEPVALARQAPVEALSTPAPTPTSRLTLFASPGGILKGAPCFDTPFTACIDQLRPTPGPGTPVPTISAGNLAGGIIPGTSKVTYWPTDTPTPTPAVP